MLPADRPGGSADTVAAVSFVLGLVLWYAGGHRAMDGLLDGATFRNLCIGMAAISAVVGFIGARSAGARKAFASAALLAAGVTLSGSSLLAIANRSFDGSVPTVEAARFVEYAKPSKGPRKATIELDGAQLRFDASAFGGACERGSKIALEVHDGALGLRWTHGGRCTPGG